MEIVKRCDIGKVRDKNQDYVDFIQISDYEAFLVVCDGMGGHAAGEIASKMTAKYILDHFMMHSEFLNDEQIKVWLHSLIHEANRLVYDRSMSSESLKGMGTTVVVAYIYQSHVYIAHVGDSRAYIIDDDIKQITIDDTLVNALVKTGTISEQEAKHHPKKNILLQAVGVSSPLSISFYKEEFKNASLLICSDGLYNSLSDEFILDIFHKNNLVEKIGDELIEKANDFGGYDNIGLVIAKKGGTGCE